MRDVRISEALAGALLNLINVGRYPFEFGQIKQVEAELFKAVENANIEIVYTEDPGAVKDAVDRLANEGENNGTGN